MSRLQRGRSSGPARTFLTKPKALDRPPTLTLMHYSEQSALAEAGIPCWDHSTAQSSLWSSSRSLRAGPELCGWSVQWGRPRPCCGSEQPAGPGQLQAPRSDGRGSTLSGHHPVSLLPKPPPVSLATHPETSFNLQNIRSNRSLRLCYKNKK